LTYCGAVSSRNFDPFPKVEVTRVDKKATPVAIHKYTIKDALECHSILKKCPKVAKLSEWVKVGTLVAELEKVDPRLYTLLRWIIASNRSHLKVLLDTLPVKASHQFVLKSTPPEKEKKFQELKKQHNGSFWAWHGSAIGNWHSILRHGLKNFSGTNKQANGAAYGPGIYMAIDSGTSLGYSGIGSVGDFWKESSLGSSITCLALCEVINMGSASNCIGGIHRPNCSHCKHAPYYRIEDEDCVVTRFLFAYKSGENVNIQAMELAKQLEQHRDMMRASQEIKK
jgi:poly [ADP-ribose] polymerase 6/8